MGLLEPKHEDVTVAIDMHFFLSNETDCPIMFQLSKAENDGHVGTMREHCDFDAWNSAHPDLLPLDSNDVVFEFQKFYGIDKIRSMITPYMPEKDVYSIRIYKFIEPDDVDYYNYSRFRCILTLFNLRDTTVWSSTTCENAESFITGSHYTNDNATDSLLAVDLFFRNDFHITINDSCLAAMHKDYSMLELFPEYYKQ